MSNLNKCEVVPDFYCKSGCMPWQECQDCIYWCTVTETEKCLDHHYALCVFTDFRWYLQIFVPSLGLVAICILLFYISFWRTKRVTMTVTPEQVLSQAIICPKCGTVQIVLAHISFFRCPMKECSSVLTVNKKNITTLSNEIMNSSTIAGISTTTFDSTNPMADPLTKSTFSQKQFNIRYHIKKKKSKKSFLSDSESSSSMDDSDDQDDSSDNSGSDSDSDSDTSGSDKESGNSDSNSSDNSINSNSNSGSSDNNDDDDSDYSYAITYRRKTDSETNLNTRFDDIDDIDNASNLNITTHRANKFRRKNSKNIRDLTLMSNS